ncbi:MAG: hypothetical protein M1834_007469 [Cirrosporium novae-zelandiae]|nr:MAG: hypothetical protein M1834_007469 [Cirrosporium novae-zelandiae]
MSVQTQEFVDGQWTTREISFEEILARNRPKGPATLPKHPPSPPTTGILTRTIAPSSRVRWILPAQIRHRDKNDVVFVYDDFIEVKELLLDGPQGEIPERLQPTPNAHLERVVIKSNFDSKILSACVCGSPRLNRITTLDETIKHEDEDIEMGEAHVESCLPPQMLVLTLTSNVVVFLYISEMASEHCQLGFVHKEYHLPTGASHFQQIGARLAIDSRSRALAISAMEGQFLLCSLKPLDLQAEFSSDGPIDPIRETLMFKVDGRILNMDFLYPPGSDDWTVYLLLLVAKSDNTTRIVCYEWDSGASLTTAARLSTSGQPLLLESAILLLIPLQMASAFMVICERSITIFRDALTGNVTSTCFPISGIPPSDSSDGIDPLWCHWARPLRGPNLQKNHGIGDALYICREDGVLRFLEIGPRPPLLKANTDAGVLNCCLDTAFTIMNLDYERGSSDVLVAGGSITDGGVHVITARKPPQLLHTLVNWSPVMDFAIEIIPRDLDTSIYPSTSRYGGAGETRIFACTSKGQHHGTVSEIRVGLEARTGLYAEEESFEGVTGIWALAGQDTGAFLLLSYPERTLLLYIQADGSEIENLSSNEFTGLHHDVETITAGNICGREAVIQITPYFVQLTDLTGSGTLKSESFGANMERILMACIDKESSSFVTVKNDQNSTSFILDLCKVSNDTGSWDIVRLDNPLLLSKEPSCLATIIDQGIHYIFVGTVAGTLQVCEYRTDISSVIPLAEHRLVVDANDTAGVCESIAFLSEGDNRTTIMCGMRDGNLLFLTFDISTPESILDQKSFSIGSTAVRVTIDKTDSRAAFVHSGSQLYRLKYKRSPLRSMSLDDIYLTDMNQVEIDERVPNRLGGSLVYLARSRLAIATLDKLPKMVPYRVAVDGSPERIIWSQHLQAFLVGCNMTRFGSNSDSFLAVIIPGQELEMKRVQTYLTSSEGSSPLKPLSEKSSLGGRGERISSMVEWMPTCDGCKYHLIVVTVLGGREGEASSRGYIRLLKPKWVADWREKLDVTVLKTTRYPEPVYSAAQFGVCSLVYSVGKRLVMTRLQEKKLVTLAVVELRSPALHITTNGTFIYTSTATDSFSVFEFKDDKFVHRMGDEIARNTIHHTTIPEQNLTLASTRSGSVTGFYHLVNDRVDPSHAPIFEAKFPAIISRLHAVSKTEVIGSTPDGAFYSLKILPEQDWRLLRFVLNLAQRSSLICPHSFSRSQITCIEPRQLSPRSMHVNGDILERLALLGPSLLRNILQSEPNPSCPESDFSTGKEREARFMELTELVMGKTHDPVESFFTYLRSWLTHWPSAHAT